MSGDRGSPILIDDTGIPTCVPQSVSSFPFGDMPGVSLFAPDNVPSSDGKSVDDAFQFNNLLNSVLGSDYMNGDDDAFFMPGQDLGSPSPNWLTAQNSNSFMSQSLTHQDPLAGESFPVFRVDANDGPAVPEHSWGQIVQNARNSIIASNNNQASGASCLQNHPLMVPSSGAVGSNLGHVSEELEGKSPTLRFGGNAEISSKPPRTYGGVHHQAITSKRGGVNRNLLIPEPNTIGDFQTLEGNNMGACLSMNNDAATLCSIHDIRPTAFSILQPPHVQHRPNYLTTNNRTFGLEDSFNARYGGIESSRGLPIQGHGPHLNRDAGQYPWTRSPSLSSPLVHGTPQHASPGGGSSNMQTFWNPPNVSSQMTSLVGQYGVIVPPTHYEPGTLGLGQPQSQHLVQPSTNSSSHGGFQPAPEIRSSSNVGPFRKRLALQHYPASSNLNPRRTRPCHLPNIQTNLSHGGSPTPPRLGQMAPAPVQAAPQVKKPSRSRTQKVSSSPGSSSSAKRQTVPIRPTILQSSPGSSASRQTVPIRPTISQSSPGSSATRQTVPVLKTISQTSPGSSSAMRHTVPIRTTISQAFPGSSSAMRQTVPVRQTISQSSPGSSAARQTVPIRPTISQSSKSLLPQAASRLRVLHKPYLQPRKPPKQIAPPVTLSPVKLSPLTVPDPDQTSSFHRIKWDCIFRDGDDDQDEQGLIGHKCTLCKRDLSYPPEGPIVETPVLPGSAVLACGHTFHDFCLQRITPPDMADDPPCIPCAIGEDIAFS